MHGVGNLLQGGIPPQLGQQPLVHRPVVFQRPAHFLAHAAGPGLQGDGLRHVVANPVIPLPFIRSVPVLPDGLPETETSLLNQIQQQHAVAHMGFGNGEHPVQSQVGQGLHGALVLFGAPRREGLLVSVGGNLCHLL